MSEIELQMARAETFGRIAVMQAWLDGKDIECHFPGDSYWSPTTSPKWEWGNIDYRVATPKPREWWLVVREGYSPFVCDSHQAASSWAYCSYGTSNNYSIVRVREVLKEDNQ